MIDYNVFKKVNVLAKQIENNVENISNELNNIKSILKVLNQINVTATGNAVASMVETGVNNVKKEIRQDFKKSFDLSKEDVFKKSNQVKSLFEKFQK